MRVQHSFGMPLWRARTLRLKMPKDATDKDTCIFTVWKTLT